MERFYLGKQVLGIGPDGVARPESFVVHTLDLIRRYDHKPGILVGVIGIPVVESKVAIGPELHLQVKQFAIYSTLHHKIGHKPQLTTRFLVVHGQQLTQRRHHPLQAKIEHIVPALNEKVLHQVLGHAAFEGVEGEIGITHSPF